MEGLWDAPSDAKPLAGVSPIKFGATRATAIPSLERDDDGLISTEQSIGIYAPGGKMESILFGVRGYYD